MDYKIYIICIAYVLCLMSSSVSPALAEEIATIHGSLYKMDTLEPIDNAVVEVNSTPSQYEVAKNGCYSIRLIPGCYTISAKYYEGGKPIYAVVSTIIIESGGDYVYDILLPRVTYENLTDSTINSIKDTSRDKVNDSNGIDPKESMKSISKNQKAENLPIISNSINNINASIEQDRIYVPFSYLQIMVIFCALFIGSFLFLWKNKRIVNNNFKETGNESISKNTSKRMNLLKSLVKDLTEDKSLEVKLESKEKKEKSFSDTEVESKLQEMSIADLKNKTAQETKFKEHIPEDELSISLDLLNNLEVDTQNIKKKNLLPEDLQEVIIMIRSQGGMISQKDLRSKLNYSEVKISVILTELEKMKRIKKFKRGRENFVVLMDWKK